MANPSSRIGHTWQVARILIYKSYIQIGCGGLGEGSAVDEALSMIENLVMRINQIRERSGAGGAPCGLDVSGNYASIKDIEGYSFIAAGIFVGMLLSSNWEFGQVTDRRIEEPAPANPKYWDTALIQRIDMRRR